MKSPTSSAATAPAFQAQYGGCWGRCICWCSRHSPPVARRSWAATCCECDACGHQKQAYNSCHNRHCPKCQAGLRGQWFEDRQRDLLPVEYFHVVFTLPDELGPLALQNKAVIYNLLFRAASQNAARSGRRVERSEGPDRLLRHPAHLGTKTRSASASALRRSRRRDLAGRHAVGQLSARLLHAGQTAEPKVPRNVFSISQRGPRSRRAHARRAAAAAGLRPGIRSWLAPLYDKEWVVYAKPPWKGPEHALKYLARYTHRVAIGNSRLQSIDDGQVAFTYKDYRNPTATRSRWPPRSSSAAS